MLRYTFVIVVVLPSLALVLVAGDNSKKGCRTENVIDASKDFATCLNIKVENSIHQKNEECSKPLENTINDFVRIVKDTCHKSDTAHVHANNYHEILEFSLKHYKEFIDHNGVACVKAARSKINACLKNYKFNANRTKDVTGSLWRNTKWNFEDKPCSEIKTVTKDCTLKVMRTEDNCKNITNILYVSSLFDYMVETCHKDNPSWDDNHRRGPVAESSGFFTHELLYKMGLTHILLAALLTLVVLGILYVVIRDCRNSGQWQKLSEQIEMKQVAVTQAIRRRSCANKDRTHEH